MTILRKLGIVQEYTNLSYFLGSDHVVQVIEFEDGLRENGHVPPHMYMELVESKDLQFARREWKLVKSPIKPVTTIGS